MITKVLGDRFNPIGHIFLKVFLKFRKVLPKSLSSMNSQYVTFKVVSASITAVC